MQTVPYNPDKVQAFGMAFCATFKAHKEFICNILDIPIDEFDYSLYRRAMKIIGGLTQ